MVRLSKVNFLYTAHNGGGAILSILPLGTEDTGSKITLPHLEEKVEVFEVSPDDKKLLRENPPKLYCELKKSELFKDIRLKEETEYEFTLEVKESETSIKAKRKINPVYPFINQKLKGFITFNSSNLWTTKNGFTTLSGRINFKGYAGVVQLPVDESISTYTHAIEVVSYKISYEEDFQILLYAIADFHSELILSLDNPTETAFKLSQTKENVSPQVLLMHLRRLMAPDRFPAALDVILSHPHFKISYFTSHNVPAMVAAPDVSDMIMNPFQHSWNKGGVLAGLFKGYSPDEISEYDHEKTFDTVENRYIKFVLFELEIILFGLKKQIPQSKTNTHYFLDNSLTFIEDSLSNPFFKQVGQFSHVTNSMVLQQRKGYKEILHYVQALEEGIVLESVLNDEDNVHGDLKAINKLYEYWCYFNLINSLSKICDGNSGSFKDLVIIDSNKSYQINLKEGGKSKVSFKYNNALTVCIYYNRNFKQHVGEWDGTYDGTTLHPDFSIEVIKDSTNERHWIHFDAKYKLDYKKLLKILSDDKEIDEDTSSYKQSDISVAHAYRDAILGSRGVFILYPDKECTTKIFIRNPDPTYYNNNSIPSIGAFPLRPGDNLQEQYDNLTTFLDTTLDTILYYGIYREEEGFL